MQFQRRIPRTERLAHDVRHGVISELDGLGIVSESAARTTAPFAAGAEPGEPPRVSTQSVRSDGHVLVAKLRVDPKARRAFISQVAPVIEARISRILSRRSGAIRRGTSSAAEIADFVQEVYLRLFDEDARILRNWDPCRGLSIRNYVGLIAEREVYDILRSSRHRQWMDRSPSDEALDMRLGTSPTPEPRVLARQMLARILRRLAEELTPKAFGLFEMLLVEGCSVEEACSATGLSRDAVYAWRSRLTKLVARAAAATVD